MTLILLTAAVTPNPAFKAAVSDVETRLRQYQDAIRDWADVTHRIGWKVIVVETTGFSVSKLLENVDSSIRHSVSVVPFSPHPESAARGKGGVEAAAMDWVLTSPDVEISNRSTVFKSTGRLVVQNADQLLKELEPNTAVVRRTVDSKYCDTRFFGTTAGFWRDNLLGMDTEVDDTSGRYLEHVMANRLHTAEYQVGSTVRRFERRPSIIGQSGTNGATYGGLSSFTRASFLGPLESMIAARLATKQI